MLIYIFPITLAGLAIIGFLINKCRKTKNTQLNPMIDV